MTNFNQIYVDKSKCRFQLSVNILHWFPRPSYYHISSPSASLPFRLKNETTYITPFFCNWIKIILGHFWWTYSIGEDEFWHPDLGHLARQEVVEVDVVLEVLASRCGVWGGSTWNFNLDSNHLMVRYICTWKKPSTWPGVQLLWNEGIPPRLCPWCSQGPWKPPPRWWCHFFLRKL